MRGGHGQVAFQENSGLAVEDIVDRLYEALDKPGADVKLLREAIDTIEDLRKVMDRIAKLEEWMKDKSIEVNRLLERKKS